MGSDVTVIMPTFRRPRELEQALRSVLDQEGVSVDVRVIDDSPDAEGEAVVAGFDDARISYSRNPVPSGGRPAAVRNLGWPEATGRFIHFLDDDDLVPRGHYAASVAEFERRADIGMIFGRIEPFGEDPASVEREREYFSRAAAKARRCQALGTKLPFAAKQFFSESMLVCSAVMIRRECVAGVGGFDVDIEFCEDADFYGRVARAYGALFTERAVLNFRIGHSLMHQRPDIAPAVERSYALMQRNYRARWGTPEFVFLKLLAKTLLRNEG